MNEHLVARIKELKIKSERAGIYTFTDFLNDEAIVASGATDGSVPYALFGGADFAERKIVRFGADCFGEEKFPISIIEVLPRGLKFALPVSHRDFLGAVMALGLERDVIGDIFVSNNAGYVIAKENIAEYIADNLSDVGRNPVRCTIVDKVPDDFAPKPVEVTVNISSLRIDAIVSHLYNLSREGGSELFDRGRVSVFGKLVLRGTYTPKLNEVFTVRGFGKFTYLGEVGKSKKGRLLVKVLKYN